MGVVDEGAHLSWAYTAVRGHFRRPLVQTPMGRASSITVPQDFAVLSELAKCITLHPDITADCQPPVPESKAAVETTSQFGRYPPLYFLAVGWPTYSFGATASLWLARVVATMMTSALLGLALWLVANFHPQRATVLGLFVAVTPMVLYLGATVNSSGLEVAASLAGWAGLLCLVEHRAPPPSLVWSTTAALVCCALSRPLTPLFVALAVAVALASGRARPLHLLRQPSVRYASVAVLAAVAGAAGWVAVVGAPPLLAFHPSERYSLLSGIRLSTSRIGQHLVDMLGNFIGLPVPSLTVGAWIVALGLVIVAFVLTGRRGRSLVAPACLPLLVIVLPLAIEVAKINQAWLWWQGRYGLPLAIGLPILIAAQLPDRLLRERRWRAVSWTILVAVGCVHISAFAFVLHRYTSGVNGHWLPPVLNWQPPGTAGLIAALFLAASLRLLWLAQTLVRPLPTRGYGPYRRALDRRVARRSPAEATVTSGYVP